MALLTILAVVRVPDHIALKSEDELLDDAVSIFTDAKQFVCEPLFAIVKQGVSEEATQLGAAPEDWTD